MADKLKLADPNGDVELDKTVVALELKERLRQMEQNVAALEKQLAEKKKANAAAEKQRQAANANNKIGARKDASFKAISTAPSINLTPRGRGMVPVPYPVVQDLAGSVKASKSVRFNGKPAYLLDQTSQPSCTGDAAGTGGGVRSGTVGGEVKPVEGSRSVRIEGKRVVREGDACTMNGGNNPGIYVTSQTPSGSIKNGKIDGDTDPPIQTQTPEEQNWLSEWWAGAKHEMGKAIEQPVEGGKGAVKGTANALPAAGELLAKAIVSQRAQELQDAAAVQNLFGQTKSAQQLAEIAQEVRRTGDAIELPKFEMSNAAQHGGDKIVTGASLLAGGAGIVKSGIKGVTAMGKAAARAEGEAVGGIADGGKMLRAEQTSVEGAKIAGGAAEAEQTAKGAEISEIHSSGDGVKIIKTNAASDPVALRRSYLNDQFGRTGNIDTDINISGNKSIIRQYVASEGLSASDANALMTGVDLTKPVTIIKLNRGKNLWQYQSPGAAQGKWYSPSKDVTPSELGIAPYGINRSTMSVEKKIASQFTTSQSTIALRSTSKSIEDTWSISPYGSFVTDGGKQQLFSPQKTIINTTK